MKETNYYKPLTRKTAKGYAIECAMDDDLYGVVVGLLEVPNEKYLLEMTGRTFKDIDWPNIVCYGDLYDTYGQLLQSGEDYRKDKSMWYCNRGVDIKVYKFDKEIEQLLSDCDLLLKKADEDENS